MAGFLAFVAIHATENLRLDGAGGVLFLFGIVVVVTRVVFARLPDRVSPFRLGAVALRLSPSACRRERRADRVPGLWSAPSSSPPGSRSPRPRCSPRSSRGCDAAHRGAASGTASLFIDLAFGGGPVLLGLVAGSAGIPAAFAVAALVAAVGAAGSALLSVDRRSAIAPASTPGVATADR